MAALKCPCPGCRMSLQIVKDPPTRVKCPRCGIRFLVERDGTTAPAAAGPNSSAILTRGAATGAVVASPPDLTIPAPASSTPEVKAPPLFLVVDHRDRGLPASSPSEVKAPPPWVPWAVYGGGALVVLLGVVLVIFCLSGDSPNSPPEVPVPPLAGAPLLPVPQVQIVPVGFVKQAPAEQTGPAGALRQGQVPAANVASAAKGITVSADPGLWKNQPLVNQAIDRGVEFLKEALNTGARTPGDSHGSRTGAIALAGLTLLSCGVPATDPAVAKAVAQVRSAAPRLGATYELAICVWFLDRLNEPQDRDLIRSMALRLIAGQGHAGGWNYNCEPLTVARQAELLALLHSSPLLPNALAGADRDPPAAPQTPPPQQPMRKPAPGKKPAPQTKKPTPPRPATGRFNRLPTDLKELPVFQFKPGQLLTREIARGHEDNSLTQFVILALWSAQKHGIPAERSLAFAEARFRASQAANGTWGYTWGTTTRTDSMTCAGLLGLAVGRGISKEAAAVGQRPSEKKGPPQERNLAKDPQIEKALLHLSSRIGMPTLGVKDRAALDKGMAEIKELQKRFQTATQEERKQIVQKIQELANAGRLPLTRGKTVGSNAWGDLYYLWSLERVAVVYDLETIGGKDWYGWGSEILVSKQQADGSWRDAFPGVVDTCFALLFLERVNVAQDLTHRLQVLGGAKDPGAKPRAPAPAHHAMAGTNKEVTGDRAGLVKSWSAALPAVPARPGGRARRKRVAARPEA